MKWLVVLAVKLLWFTAAIAIFAMLSAFYPVMSAIVLIVLAFMLCCPCLAMCLCKCTLGNIDGALNVAMAMVAAVAAGYTLHQNKDCGLPSAGYDVITCDDVRVVSIASIVLASAAAVIQLILLNCSKIISPSDLEESLFSP